MNPGASQTDGVTGADAIIWRYMDLPRFVAMLSTNSLWFAKAATLHDDPYEGYGTAQWFEAPSVDESPKSVARKRDGKETNVTFPQMFATVGEMSAKTFENRREQLYVNSWCLGAVESMAMWQIYGSLGSGIAVKSSVERYESAAKFGVSAPHYRFGNVTYHDRIELAPEVQGDFRATVPAPGLGIGREILKLAFHKRSYYSYENEWRVALFQAHRPGLLGVSIAFDLEQLINEVYVGPRAPGFLVDVVSAVMDKFLLRKPLRQSELLNSPHERKTASAG